MTDQPAPAYLDPLHDELDRLRTENERLTGSLEIALGHITSTNHPEDALRFARMHVEAALSGRSQPLAMANGRAEMAERRLEQAEARVDQLTDQLALANDTLRRRGDAVNATGTSNDQLRATLDQVRKIRNEFALLPETWIGPRVNSLDVLAALNAALADQEPTP